MLTREEQVLTQLLLARRKLSPEQMQVAITRCLEKGDPLAASLVMSGLLSVEDSESFGYEAAAIAAAISTGPPAEEILDDFRLVREIGRGGMGIVFEAVQESLGRHVAVKILPPGLALDSRSASRFIREARAVARLNHPGIVPVYGCGQSHGTLYFAMELIDGPSLDQQLRKRPLTARAAAGVAVQMARALQHAHDHGLIHRDVKPANVLIDAQGAARLTDFGLVHDVEAESFTISSAMLGTPAYMAPEQARGGPATAAVDIYGVGAALYSMLSGKAPYAGGSAGATLMQVLTTAPRHLTEINSALPRELVAICAQAMGRTARDRYASAGALADDLERWLRGDAVQAPPARMKWAPRSKRRWGAIGAIALLIVLAAVASLGWSHRTARLVDGQLTQLTRLPGREMFPSLSRDAGRLTFGSNLTGNWDVYLQSRIGQQEPVNLTADSAVYDGEAAIAPDGRSVVFRSDRDGGGLFVIDTENRAIRRLTRFGGNPAWSLDGTRIAFSTVSTFGPSANTTNGEVWIIEAAGGDPRRVVGGGAVQPAWSPDGRRLVYWLAREQHSNLFTVPIDGGDAVQVTDDQFANWNPVWSPDGAYIYFSSDRGGPMNVWRVPVDPPSGAPLGVPEPVTRGTGSPNYYVSCSADGATVAFVSRLYREDSYVVPFDPERGIVIGRPRLFTSQPDFAGTISSSPDGKELVMSAQGATPGIAVLDAHGTIRRWLLRDAARNRAPSWSPRGDRIAFYSDRDGRMGIWLVYADGASLTRVPTPGVSSATFPIWSPDSTRLAITDEKRGAAVVRLSDGAVELLPPMSASGATFEPWSWSPRGDLLAGSARGVVVFDLERKAYSRLTTSGEKPLWLADGQRLLYSDAGRILMVDSRGGESLEVYAGGAQRLAPEFSLSADAKTLFVTQIFSEGDVWMLRLR